jgi:hypothetical protein
LGTYSYNSSHNVTLSDTGYTITFGSTRYSGVFAVASNGTTVGVELAENRTYLFQVRDINTLIDPDGDAWVRQGTAPASGAGTFVGTYSYGSNYAITLTDTGFTMNWGGTTSSGIYVWSSNGTITPILPDNNTSYEFKIRDANTLIDKDGDPWVRQAASAQAQDSKSVSGALSGTYYYYYNSIAFRGIYYSFSGSNCTMVVTDSTYNGTYTVTGNTVTVTFADNSTFILQIRDTDTLVDSDGDLWVRERTTPSSTSAGASGTLSGTYSYGSNYTVTFSGSNYTMTLESYTFSGTYTMSGNTATLIVADTTSLVFQIRDANTLVDEDGDVWTRR